ncbi:MAG TPA: hypothetical protein VI757_02115 [Bacteroidia bacterium]|nr:hypothetical protein [Bacteroidia bacterium]
MAKLITDEEASELGMRPFGKKHFVRVLIEQLQPGQRLYITRADFTWRKQNPNYFINPLMKTTSKKFTITETRTRSGWIVVRVE